MHNSTSRKVNSAKGIVYTLSSNILKIVLQFVMRSVFIYALSISYLGINSVYSGILNVLSLSELGIGTAVAFNLYKPVRDNDIEKINSIINVYKKLYLVVGAVVLGIGLCIIPFLKYIVTDIQGVDVNITIAYLFSLFTTASSYVCSYRNILFTVYQQQYKESIINFITTLLGLLLQIVTILIFKNYYAFLVASFVSGLLSNLVLFGLSTKYYQHVKTKNAVKLDSETKLSLKNNIKGMFFHKLSYAVLQGTDSIIISAFVSTTILGIYSNYLTFTNNLLVIFTTISIAIMGSVGNLIAEDNKQKSYEIFKYLRFAFFWLAGFCAIGLFCLLNPTITIWAKISSWDANTTWTFDLFTVFIISFNFYINSSRIITGTFRSAIGMFNKDKWKGLIEAILNIIFSLIFVKFFGIAGVLMGTILSVCFSSIIVDPYMLYKYHFEKPVKYQFSYILIYSLAVLVVGFLTYFLCSLIPGLGVVSFIYKLLICLVVPNVLFLLLSFKTKEFKGLLNMAK